VTTGRKRGSNRAYGDALVEKEKEKKSAGGRRRFGRKKAVEEV